MKRSLYLLIVLSILGFTGLQAQSELHTPGEYVPNEIMVMLRPGNVIEDLIKDLNDDGLVGQFRMKQELSKRYRIYLIEHDAVLGDSKKLLYDVNKMDQVALAQLNHYIFERATPNDVGFSPNQWNMHNTGQSGGVADADIDAPEAWEITTGGVTVDGDTIVIAVVDGGAQENHPDLTLWRNYNEIAGNSIDDDGNGYVDDTEGWDAQTNDNNVPGISSHATHCSGIAGATGNNSAGVAGVNWNVKILNMRGSSGTESIVVLAYDYIASLRSLYNTTNGSKGAFIVATSNSFGVDFGMPSSYPIWCAMYDTLGTLGILSAGAGPNANTNIDTQGDIPTTCPSNYLIAVTNTTRTDARNSSCGYGPINMDIGAPGTDIYSCTTGSSYTTMTGTSMATPHVAGAVGLYFAGACTEFIQDYKANPGTMALQMRTYLLTGVDSITSMATTTSSQGRLNLHKGLLKVKTYGCCPDVTPVITDNGGTLQSSETGAGNQWYLNGNPIAGATNSTYVPTQGGVYTVIYTSGIGCTDTSAAYISTIGIEDNNISFSVYPNPVTDKLIIDAGTVVKATIQVMDLSGRVVINTRMNQALQQIDVTGLADGVYMIRLEYSGKSITRKIVKH